MGATRWNHEGFWCCTCALQRVLAAPRQPRAPSSTSVLRQEQAPSSPSLGVEEGPQPETRGHGAAAGSCSLTLPLVPLPAPGGAFTSCSGLPHRGSRYRSYSEIKRRLKDLLIIETSRVSF